MNAHFTQNFRPKQVYGPRTVHQVAERRKRSKDKEVQDKKRGRLERRSQELGARSARVRGHPGTRPGHTASIGFVTVRSVHPFHGENW